MHPKHRFGSLVTATCLAAMLSGCGGSSNTRMDTDTGMTDGTDTGMTDGTDTGMTDGTDTGMTDGTDMLDLGEWDEVVVQGVVTGIENTTHGLRAHYDANGQNPVITPSAPSHQPTVSGTWTGRWEAAIGPDLDEEDEGVAKVAVSMQGSNVRATLTYMGVDGFGTITSAPATVTDGRFRPSATVNVQGAAITFSGAGQFGGTDQRGVVGYVGGSEFRSVFYGDRSN